MADLRAMLASHTVIGLDTNPFIYLFERHPTYFSVVEILFDHLKSSNVQGITSIVTLIETYVQPQRNGRLDLVKIYEQALLNSRQVQTLPVTPAVAKQAIQLRATYDLRVPDALQIGTALGSDATLFVTNDHRLQKVAELPILLLDEYIS